ncbi:MAG TPA: 50S ribosomal protein L11 methyltransferase, partial [Leeuwenhoekiella sp.]|nr:50S ribosomal protein L11 methyltransferase [Leeuwenhoekiella sp.]
MAEIYAEYEFKVAPVNPGAEILIAELSQLDFESFDETDEGVKAYILASLNKENILDDVNILNNPEFKISYSVNTIEPVNWNEEWEKNFEPIEVDGICSVRAPFHPK